jgi:hypothetical protein
MDATRILPYSEYFRAVHAISIRCLPAQMMALPPLA